MTSSHQHITSPPLEASPNRFDSPLANQAEQLLRDRLDRFLERNAFARELSRRMREETATDFFEWIDHLALDTEDAAPLRAAGFCLQEKVETADREPVYAHPSATLPRVLLRHRKGPAAGSGALRQI